jgi:hypothetical protein
MRFSYVIDTGADMSVLRQSAATRLDASITPEVRVLSGLSANNVCSIGTCKLIAVLQLSKRCSWPMMSCPQLETLLSVGILLGYRI